MKTRALVVGAMATFVLVPAGARAETSDLDRAIALAAEGRCDEAMGTLSRAAAIEPTPVVMSRLGECLIAKGRIVEGTNDLAWVLQQPMTDRDDDTLRSVGFLVEARERARTALAAAEPRIAKLEVAVAAPAGANVTIQIDAVAATGRKRVELVDPGEHVVVATAPGYTSASATVRLRDGAANAIALVIAPAPTPIVTTSRSTSLSSVPEATPREGTPNRVPGFLVLGAGTGLLATGIGLGLASIAKTHDLQAECTGTVCPPNAQSSIDAARRLGTVSTISLVAGLAGIATGGFLLAFPPRTTITPTVGLGSAGVAGSF